MFEHITPTASATPDGDYQVDRRFRWIPEHKLQSITAIEQAHRDQIANEAVIVKRDFHPTKVAETVGLRKDAAIHNNWKSMRRKRGPGFKVRQRIEDRITKLEKQTDLRLKELFGVLDLRESR